MPSVLSSGSQLTVLSTEHTLVDSTTAGTHLLAVDTNVLANGDTIELRIYSKVLTGGTARVLYMASYSHAQAEPIKFSIPVPTIWNFKATLKQTAGSVRTFPWEAITL